MTELPITTGDLTPDVLTKILRHTGSDITADDVVETDRQERLARHLPTNPGGTP